MLQAPIVIQEYWRKVIKESILSVQRRKDGGASCAWSLLMNFEKVHSWSEIMKKNRHTFMLMSVIGISCKT